MTWQDVGKKIVQWAPTAAGLAAPFLGPAGPLLPVAIKALCNAFGITDPNPTPDLVHQALQNMFQTDPDFQAKLALAQIDFQKEEMRLEFADIANARQRQIEHERATGKSDINLYALAWLFVIGFFASYIVLLVMIFSEHFPAEIPPAAVYFMGTLNGTLTAGVGAVVQYFFGKTKDTAAHVDMLANYIPMNQLQKVMNCGAAMGGTKP